MRHCSLTGHTFDGIPDIWGESGLAALKSAVNFALLLLQNAAASRTHACRCAPMVEAQCDDAGHILERHVVAALKGDQRSRRAVHHHVPPNAVHLQQRADLPAKTKRPLVLLQIFDAKSTGITQRMPSTSQQRRDLPPAHDIVKGCNKRRSGSKNAIVAAGQHLTPRAAG